MPELQLDLALGEDRVRIAKVLAVVRRHAGRENAISLDAIAAETGLNRRDVQSIVKFLVEERSWPIGTALSAPFGYYKAIREEELEENYKAFVRRGLSCLRHARAYRKDSVLGPIVGQLELVTNDRKEGS